jgi:hypothetical protein
MREFLNEDYKNGVGVDGTHGEPDGEEEEEITRAE